MSTRDLQDDRDLTLTYNYDLDGLAEKMQMGVQVRDHKTRYGRHIRRCFTGQEAVDRLLKINAVYEVSEAEALLNRMIRKGKITHVNGNKLMDGGARSYYRFAEDEFQVMLEKAGPKRRHRDQGAGVSLPLGSSASGGTQDGNGADSVPWLARRKYRVATRKLKQGIKPQDVAQGAKVHCRAFMGSEAMDVLHEQGLAEGPEHAQLLGLALQRVGVLQPVVAGTLFGPKELFRFAEDHYALLAESSALLGSGSNAVPEPDRMDMDENLQMSLRDLTYLSSSTGAPLEPAYLSRYWTTHQASQMYMMDVHIVGGSLVVGSVGWDAKGEESLQCHCECYLTCKKAAKSCTRPASSLHPVWRHHAVFPEVDYMDTVRIDLKAKGGLLHHEVQLGTLTFQVHEAMSSLREELLLEFEVTSKMHLQAATLLVSVMFDPPVTGNGGADSMMGSVLRRQSLLHIMRAASPPNRAKGGPKGGLANGLANGKDTASTGVRRLSLLEGAYILAEREQAGGATWDPGRYRRKSSIRRRSSCDRYSRPQSAPAPTLANTCLSVDGFFGALTLDADSTWVDTTYHAPRRRGSKGERAADPVLSPPAPPELSGAGLLWGANLGQGDRMEPPIQFNFSHVAPPRRRSSLRSSLGSDLDDIVEGQPAAAARSANGDGFPLQSVPPLPRQPNWRLGSSSRQKSGRPEVLRVAASRTVQQKAPGPLLHARATSE